VLVYEQIPILVVAVAVGVVVVVVVAVAEVAAVGGDTTVEVLLDSYGPLHHCQQLSHTI
jgi:hypothetical protein